MNSIQSLFPYMGNKIQIANWIVPMFPSHKIYVEVFGGTFAIGMNKPSSQVEVYNDKNYHLSNLFEAIRKDKDKLIEEFTSHNVNEVFYDKYYQNHEPKELGDIEAAVRYLYIMSLCAYGKYNGGFQPSFKESTKWIFERKAKIIDSIYKRIKSTIVMSRNFDRILKNCDTEHTLFYLDPPYKDTEGYYKTIVGDFTMEDHERLRDALRKVKGKFYLSYEANEFIEDMYSGDDFHILSKSKVRQGQKSKDGKASKAEEIVITNFKPRTSLFDQ